MTLFSFLGKGSGGKGMASVSIESTGVSLSHAVLGRNSVPRLRICDFSLCEDASRYAGVLATMVQQHSLEGTRCVYVLKPGEYQLYLVERPDVAAEELRYAIRWRIKDLINFPIEEAAVDAFPVPTMEFQEKKMAYAIVTQQSVVDKAVAIVNGAELELDAVDISELALRNLVKFTEYSGYSTAFLRISHPDSQLVIMQESEVFMSRRIDLDLSRWASQKIVTLNQQEDSSSEGDLRVLDDLILEVQRSLDYCASEFGLMPATHLLLGPLHSEHRAELANYLTSNLSIQIDMLDLNNVLDCKMNIDDEVQPQSLLTVGGALRDDD